MHYESSSRAAIRARRIRYAKRRRQRRLRLILAGSFLCICTITITTKTVIAMQKNKPEIVCPTQTPLYDHIVDDNLSQDNSPPNDNTLLNDNTLHNDNSLPNDNTLPNDYENTQTDNSDVSPKDEPAEYDYAKPVPLSDTVDTSYFDDAVFIGDSRSEGFLLSTGLSNAIGFTNKGLMVNTAFTDKVINLDGAKVTVMDALKRTTFSKVYIMLGINETGWPYNNVFIEKYGEIIDEIKEINPQAVIYVQSILPVSKEVSSTHSYVKNSKINEYNTLIKKMAEEKKVYYINVAEAVAGEDGALPQEAAVDGIHFKKEYCEKWFEYLKTHTVSEN